MVIVTKISIQFICWFTSIHNVEMILSACGPTRTNTDPQRPTRTNTDPQQYDDKTHVSTDVMFDISSTAVHTNTQKHKHVPLLT